MYKKKTNWIPYLNELEEQGMNPFWERLKKRYLLEFPTATENEISTFFMKVTAYLADYSGDIESCLREIIKEEKELKEIAYHAKGVK